MKTIKRVLRGLIPPIFLIFLSRLSYYRSHGSLKFFRKTYFGVFSSFEEVYKYFKGEEALTSYNSKESEALEKAQMMSIKSKIRNLHEGYIPDNHDRYSVLTELVGLQQKDPIRVIDVGGAPGLGLLYLKFSTPDKKIDLTVIELESISDIGNEIFEDTPEIKFYSDLAVIEEKPYDVAFFGSSLQYFEDYELVIKKVIRFKPTYVAIVDSKLGTAGTFVTAQVNMPKRIIPQKVINKNQLIGLLEKNEYSLIFKNTNLREDNFNNFPYPHSQSMSWNLIFKIQGHPGFK